MTELNCVWLPPPADLTLLSDEVHVWRASLNLPSLSLQNLHHTLAEDEQGRAERFYFQKDRHHFIAARGILRAILSRYLNVEPNQLRFSYSNYGKPSLVPIGNHGILNFNVSHSHGLALYAVNWNRETGVDLEYIRTNLEYEQIAERFFSDQEIASLRTVPPAMKFKAFFNCWTRKEAYIKAIGEGLSMPLDQFDVSLAPGDPAKLLSTRPDPQEASRWSLQALPLDPDYSGALVVKGHDWRLKCWHWTRG